MARKLLITLLVISLLFELFITGMSFFAKESSLNRIGGVLNSDTDFLGYIIAWCLLFVSLICSLALYKVVENGDYKALCYVLGLWWIAIGVGIYFVFKKPDNLLTDSLKGLLLVILTWWNTKDAKKPVYRS
jgi:hypothetical protein